MSLPGRWRWCDRPGFCDARKAQNALHTLIHQRRLTPSCGGLAPTAERTMDPARIFTESLTPRPELYQTAETLTHLCHRPRPSTAPISHWTTVRFCNECPGGALAA